MAVEYVLIDRILYIICRGKYTPREIKSSLTTGLDEVPAGTDLALDVTQSVGAPSRNEIVETAELIAEQRSRIRGQLVLIAGGDLQFGMGRMLSLLLEARSVRMEVFRGRQQALEWLGADEADRTV